MKKIYYCANYSDYKLWKSWGVINKILAQMNVFASAGYECELNDIKRERGLKFLFCVCNPFISIYKWEVEKVKEADYLYIRLIYIDGGFFSFLKRVKKINPKLKIVLEIPTYPYKTEWKLIQKVLFSLKEQMYEKRIKEFINRITIIGNEQKEIYGIKTIVLKNGIDFSKISIRKKTEMNEEIHLIAVSTLSLYHGYDRVIEGLNIYYKAGGKRKIIFDIVGEGPEKELLQKLVKKYNLEEKVNFWGFKKEAELDDIYDKADIGIECLGSHRKKLEVSSSLKSREYVAKGLPFITSNKIDVFDEEWFILKQSNDDRPISIDEVINFYDKIYNKKEIFEVSTKIREIGLDKIDINVTMEKVIDYYEDRDSVK